MTSGNMNILETLNVKAKYLKKQACTLYLTAKDKRTPWYARVFILAIVGYALSPIDLIPDFIPVLGYFDDLIIIPVAIIIAIKLIPKDVYQDCQEEAKFEQLNTKAKWAASSLIAIIWLLIIGAIIRAIWE